MDAHQRPSGSQPIRRQNGEKDASSVGTPSGRVEKHVAELSIHLLEDAEHAHQRAQRAASALRESDELNRTLFESSPDCVKVLDSDGNLLRMNERGLCLLEIDRFASVLGKQWWKLWPDDLQPRVKAAIVKARAGQTDRFQGYCPTAKGTPRWWDVVIAPVFDAQHRITSLISVSRDVTDRHRAEEAITAAANYAEAILRTSPVSLLVLESNLRVVTANEAFYKRFQVKPEETEGRLVYELGNRQWDIPKLRELLENILPHQSWFEHYEVTHRFESIGRRTMLLNARRMEVEEGGPKRVILVIEDITERKQKEEDAQFLAELTERLRVAERPDELIARVAGLTGVYFGVDRCYFAEVDEDRDRWALKEDYHAGLPSMRGEHRLSDFPRSIRDHLRAGRRLLAQDTKTDPRSAPLYEASYAPLGIRAHVDIPLTRSGRWVAALTVASSTARAWEPRELELLEVIAERTWSAVEKLMLDADLRASERRSRTIADEIQATYDQSPVGMLQLDRDLRYVRINERLAAMNGLPAADHLGKTIHEIVPDLAPQLEADFRRIIETGEPMLGIEIQGQTMADPGVRHTFLESWFPLRNSAGQVVGLNVVAEDITERKRIEESLRESEQRFRTLFESMDEGYCVIEFLDGPHGPLSDYVHVLANPAYTTNAGIPNIVGQRVREMVPDEAAAWVETYREVLLTGKAIRFERELVATGRHLDLAAFRIEPPERRQVAVLFRDVTDRKRSEQAIRESEERFRMVADNMGQLAWTCDQLGNVTWYNQRWLDYTGLTFEQMKDWGWKQCHHPDHIDRVVASVTRSRESGEIWEDTFPLRSKEGEYRWFLSRAYPIKNAHGKIVRWFGTNTDVTDQRRAEESLRVHQLTLEQQVRERTERLRTADRMAAVGTLASGLAHDMNNLLAPLGVRVEMLLAGKPHDPETQHELSVITALLDHLRTLSRNLALFARDPAKEGIVGRTNVAQWCASVRKLLDASVGRDLVIQWDCPEDLPDVAIAPHRLTQAVQNLIHNARDAVLAVTSRDAERRPQIIVECRRKDATSVSVRVADNGVGMGAETLHRCIEPFFTTRDRPTELGVGGSGLGMSLAHQIAEGAGGRMCIESTLGAGTTVTLTLPIAP